MRIIQRLALFFFFVFSFNLFADDQTRKDAKYEWRNIKYGLSKTVPHPWAKIGRKGKKIYLTNKTINYSSSFIPDQITIGNTALFERKPLVTMKVNGHVITGDDFKTTVVNSAEDKVRLQSIFRGSNYIVDVISTIEYDGFIKIDLNITPKHKSTITIDEFSIDILYRQGIIQRYSKYLEYDFDLQKIKKSSFVDSNGVISKGDRYYPFNPSFWLGNKNIGMEWISETNHNYFLRDIKKTHKVYHSNRSIGFRTEIIDKKVKIKKQLLYSFSFFLTPSKKNNNRQDNLYLSASMSPQRAKKVAEKYPHMSMLYNGHWKGVPIKYPGLPLPPGDQVKKYKSIRNILKNNNIKYIPYATLYLLPSTLKEMDDYSLEWRSANKRKGSKFWRDRIDAAYPVQPITLDSESIQDYLLYQHIKNIDKYKTDGIYFDVSLFWDLEYTLQRFIEKKNISKNKRGLVFYPMYSHRNFLKRFWKESKKRNENFIIMHHTGSNIPKFALAYIDIAVIGESFHRLFSDKRLKTVSVNNKRRYLFPGSYTPDYFSIPDDFLEGFNEKGVKFMLLPEVKRFNNKYLLENKNKYIKWSRSAIAIAYEYDFLLWHTRINNKVLKRFVTALRKFYFYSKKYSNISIDFEVRGKDIDSGSIFEKTLQRGREYLMFISNKSNKDGKVRLNSTSFNNNKFIKLYNAETHTPLPYTSNEIELTIPKKDYILVKIITE